jgi:glycosyltransferase involved in cell wall biosynthesis
VFLEAMAFRKPIVAVAAGGSTDLVENEINGLLVPAHNPAQLANALGRLIGDDAFVRHLADAASRGFTLSLASGALSQSSMRFSGALREGP